MQGHLFKYKDKDGKWIEIPILVESMYNAYVAYCTQKNKTPVPEETYYQSVGELQLLVNKLDGSAEQVSKLIAALGAGVLPQKLGGLGVAIGTDGDYNTLQAALVALAEVATIQQLNALNTKAEELAASLDALYASTNAFLADKENVASFSKGDKIPDENTPGKYYFQHS